MKTTVHHIVAPVIGIHRHRLNIDGRGITTLVGLHGCPLHCQYCLNNNCHTPDGVWRELSARELYDVVKADDLYFRATGGGVTFGGGEPALHSLFIEEFCTMCDNDWNITLETSLHVPQEDLSRLVEVVDDYIVDIKSLNEDIYRAYTHCELKRTIDNLHYLIEQGKASHIMVRVPLIAQYNDREDVDATVKQLHQWGIENIEQFTYQTTPQKGGVNRPTRTGKKICEILKKVRCIIADANHIAYTPTPCTHTVCTGGHCPVCEQELSLLTQELSQRENIII